MEEVQCRTIPDHVAKSKEVDSPAKQNDKNFRVGFLLKALGFVRRKWGKTCETPLQYTK